MIFRSFRLEYFSTGILWNATLILINIIKECEWFAGCFWKNSWIIPVFWLSIFQDRPFLAHGLSSANFSTFASMIKCFKATPTAKKLPPDLVLGFQLLSCGEQLQISVFRGILCKWNALNLRPPEGQSVKRALHRGSIRHNLHLLGGDGYWWRLWS